MSPPLLEFNCFEKMARRTQERCTHWIRGCCKRCNRRWKRWVGGKAIARVPPRVHQSGSSSNPILLGFYGGFNRERRLAKALATAG